MDLPTRVWDKIERITESGCWIWMGSCVNGYGEVWWQGHRVKVHRLIYATLKEPIPLYNPSRKGRMELDHLCRVPCCCNPEHLEHVSNSVNVRRGTAWHHVVAKHKAATHCQRGHAWTLENTYIEPNGKRRCLECKRLRLRNWRKNHAAKG